MFGFSGAHRVGKSTLAKAVAEKAGWAYCQTNVSGVFAELGLDVRANYDWATRMQIQNAALESLARSYRALDAAPFVADRTPLDVLMYTWADVQRQTLDDEGRKSFWQHWERAMAITRRHFVGIMMIQPGIEVVDDPNKAPPCDVYIEHLNALMKELVCERCPVKGAYLYREERDLGRRTLLSLQYFQSILSADVAMNNDARRYGH
jgi:hypothetical protein